MARKLTISDYIRKPKNTRPGIHAKTKHSNSKKSKHYVKKKRGQG